MANQSGKKQQQRKEVKNKFSKIAIILITLFYIAINAYLVLFKEKVYSNSDTLGFLFLTIINFALYRVLDVFESSQFYMPLLDLLIINLSVEVLINFHWKFWFLYLIVPGYFIVIGARKVYEHVKTVGKAEEGEQTEDPRAVKSSSQKEKKKIVKIKN